MKIRLLGCCSLGLILTWVGALHADGVVRDSIGAISSGRGGANIGYADNGAILNSNPAAMTNIRGSGLWYDR